MIRVYCDQGVNQRPLESLLQGLLHHKVQTITAKEIIEGTWLSDTTLLIIPGGRDIPYHEALKGPGNANIRGFVENGGSFLGICAGAYFGSAKVEFDLGMPLEVVGQRELAFFPGVAKGPAMGPGTFCYRSDKGAYATLLSDNFSGKDLKVYLNGGCVFVDAEKHPETEVISRYLQIPETPAAIICCKVGRGQAVLSGVHFELGLSSTPIAIPEKLRDTLQEHEKKRKRFFDRIIHQLL